MKKLIYTLILVCAVNFSFGQAAWIEPENPDVTQPVRLYVDFDKTTNTSCKDLPGPFYIWTWKPIEHPAGSPKVNGTGDKPWKNSNDVLVMIKDESKGPHVWYYEMTPTEFYEVPATDIYSKGISFLAKPKDGGGFGDPDFKTEDFNIVVSPPKLTRGAIYQVPSVVLPAEMVTVIYDNSADTVKAMQNIPSDDSYFLWIKCTGTDTVSGATIVYQPSSFFMASTNPALELKFDAVTQKYYLTIIPSLFFGFSPTFKAKDMECTVRRRLTADRTTEQPKIKFGCD